MEKTWVKDVKEGERVKAIFAVARKAVPTAKSGKSYLAATLVDRTGEIEARSFDRVDEFSALFEEKDLVEVEGAIGSFQGRPQLSPGWRPPSRASRRRPRPTTPATRPGRSSTASSRPSPTST